MRFDDTSYYRAYDHNYRVAYEEGLAFLGEGGSRRELRRLKRMLGRILHDPLETGILDVGCGDGTVGVFLAGLGYRYLGVDVSEAAIDRAGQRCAEAGVDAGFRVADALDTESLPADGFDVVVDCGCFHMLVVDAHREKYLKNVRRAMRDGGHFILFGSHDPDAYDGPVDSFGEFCRKTGTNTSGVPFQKCVGDHWMNVNGRRVYLMGRPRSVKGYRAELTAAGFRILYRTTCRRDPRDAGFLMQKDVGVPDA
ncbi:MAG: class I SAM-dependent methyltransferase [Gemmatimonadota bacterium]|nr:class I SAM-dependent methyltransferase [Gemmatimonadota bacterium]